MTNHAGSDIQLSLMVFCVTWILHCRQLCTQNNWGFFCSDIISFFSLFLGSIAFRESTFHGYGFIFLLGTESSGTSLANPTCGGTYTYSLQVGKGTSFFCHPSLKGRFVIIRILKPNTPLTLCEVEVYSQRRGVHALIYTDTLFDCTSRKKKTFLKFPYEFPAFWLIFLVVVQIMQIMSFRQLFGVILLTSRSNSWHRCISQYCRRMYRFTFLGQSLCYCDCCTKNGTMFCLLSG